MQKVAWEKRYSTYNNVLLVKIGQNENFPFSQAISKTWNVAKIDDEFESYLITCPKNTLNFTLGSLGCK